MYAMQRSILCSGWLMREMPRRWLTTLGGEEPKHCTSARVDGRSHLVIILLSSVETALVLLFCMFLVCALKVDFVFHDCQKPLKSKRDAQACVAALLTGSFIAIAFFVYSWSPSRWFEGRMKAATRAIFAPGNLGEWQLRLVKRQASWGV